MPREPDRGGYLRTIYFRASPALRELGSASAVAVATLAVVLELGAVPFATRLVASSTLLALLLAAITIRRVRERSRVEEALSESQGRLHALFDDAVDVVFSCDLKGRITAINDAGSRLTGYSRDALEDMQIGSLLALDEYNGGNEDGNDNIGIVPGLTPGLHEVELITRNGRRVALEVRTQMVLRRGQPVGIQGIARDVQERRRFERELLHLASYDPLTELFNRGRFEQELYLQVVRAKRYRTTGAVVFLDLDHFKDVNDTLGHAAGDELLVALSKRFRAGLRESDIAARLGGDEFTAIVPDVDRDGARMAADRLLEAIRREPFAVARQTFSVTASAGIAMILPDGTETAAELLSHADLAMYQAKEKGRNTVCTYEEGVDVALMNSNFGWRRRIWEAFEQNRFILYAQPIMDLRSGETPAYELLLRLRETDGEVIDAGRFVDKAERFGMMPAIDRWVVRKAIRLLLDHDRLTFAVNLSSRALSDEQLLPLIRAELESASVDPSRLIIEVTETTAIENVHAAQQFVSDLKQLGCRFAIDDFGAGFSSFYHLKMLDVDYLKIDGSLVRDLPREPVDQHLVRAIVEVARALGKEVIAEFVTDAETLKIVRELGVDYAQGYHVGLPADVTSAVTDSGTSTRAA